MTEPIQRLLQRIHADFEPGTADKVARRLRTLSEEQFGGQGAERIQAALVFMSHGSWGRFVDGLGVLEQDWRDLLVNGGLADDDWPAVLASELGATST